MSRQTTRAKTTFVLLTMLLSMLGKGVAAPLGRLNEAVTHTLTEVEEHRATQLEQLYDYVSRVLPAESHSPTPPGHYTHPTFPSFNSPQLLSEGHTAAPNERSLRYAARTRGRGAAGTRREAVGDWTTNQEMKMEREVVQRGQIAPPNTPERFPTSYEYFGDGGSTKRVLKF